MTAITTTTQPASASALRQAIIRHPLLAYLALAFAGTWVVQLPLWLSRDGLGLLPYTLPILPAMLLFVLSVWAGPTLAALVVTATESGRAGVRGFLRRYVHWRVGLRWYLVVLLGFPLLYLLAAKVRLSIKQGNRSPGRGMHEERNEPSHHTSACVRKPRVGHAQGALALPSAHALTSTNNDGYRQIRQNAAEQRMARETRSWRVVGCSADPSGVEKQGANTSHHTSLDCMRHRLTLKVTAISACTRGTTAGLKALRLFIQLQLGSAGRAPAPNTSRRLATVLPSQKDLKVGLIRVPQVMVESSVRPAFA
jgi:hypothetical protein